MAFSQLFCQAVHQRLASVSGQNAAELNRQAMGLLEAITSPINRQGLEMIPIDDGTGRVRDVRIYYMEQTPVTSIVNAKPNFCNTQTAKEPQSVLVQVDRARYTPGRRLRDEDLHRICGEGLNEQGLLLDYLLTDAAALLESVNQDLWATLAVNFGNHYNSTNAAVPVNLLTNTGAPIYDGFSQVLQAYRRVRGVGRPIVVGEGIVDRYMRAVNNGCCNDAGIDLSRAIGEAYFFNDLNANTALGVNHFAVLSPGTVHLVQWRRHQGAFLRDFGSSIKTSFLDPISNLELDLHLEWQGCEERWVWTMGIHYAIFIMPSPWTDPALTGANGTLRFVGQQLP